MNLFVNQNITIHKLEIGGVSNSSVFQIGSAGIIKPLSNLFNSGGFTGPAPEIEEEATMIDRPPQVFVPPTLIPAQPFVPLTTP
ncbi:spore germination protein GerPB [Ammoniphilus sp. YIM 78166]|uniref:spore germination protein GerPB n=1 Tax=Ammoniphilus sp. YIM 78166 TaxID=1644106 RepID=UPI00106F3BC4|nr:spore germination protein GerPB [Ammoniphilus sp. YIM 78166]